MRSVDLRSFCLGHHRWVSMLDPECDDYSLVPPAASVAVATAVVVAVGAAGGMTLDLAVSVACAPSCHCWELTPSHQRKAPGHAGVD